MEQLVGMEWSELAGEPMMPEVDSLMRWLESPDSNDDWWLEATDPPADHHYHHFDLVPSRDASPEQIVKPVLEPGWETAEYCWTSTVDPSSLLPNPLHDADLLEYEPPRHVQMFVEQPVLVESVEDQHMSPTLSASTVDMSPDYHQQHQVEDELQQGELVWEEDKVDEDESNEDDDDDDHDYLEELPKKKATTSRRGKSTPFKTPKSKPYKPRLSSRPKNAEETRLLVNRLAARNYRERKKCEVFEQNQIRVRMEERHADLLSQQQSLERQIAHIKLLMGLA